MRVLIACEYSGRVREAFRRRGHEAWSCDLLPAEDNSPYHITGDVLPLLSQGWDMLIGFPPCTYLANSGVRWLYERGTRNRIEARWEAMRKGAAFLRALWDSHIARVALENPIMHKHGRALVQIPHTQIIQPWMFGHGETKATCLRLRGLPPLVPTNRVAGREQRVWKMGPSKDRWKERSRTFTGVAEAMADQWGGLAA